jgi:hypothetical protein
MKTSNIIIIALASFIVAGMLILFVDAKLHIKNLKTNVSYKEFVLPAFSVIVAEKGSNLHLDQSDSTFIKVEYLKDKPVPKKMYKVSNDTLYVYGGLRTFVKCPIITSFIGNKPFWVGLNGFKQVHFLSIKMYGGKLNFNANKSKHNLKNDIQKLVNLEVIANDSAYLNIKNLKLQNLSIALNNAQIEMNCPSKNATLKLENYARMSCYNNFENLTVQKDTSSVFGTNQFPYNR